MHVHVGALAGQRLLLTPVERDVAADRFCAPRADLGALVRRPGRDGRGPLGLRAHRRAGGAPDTAPLALADPCEAATPPS